MQSSSNAFRLPGPAIAVPKAPAKKESPPSPYETVRYYQYMQGMPCYRGWPWGERESLYDDSHPWGCHHDSGGLCGCDEPVVRRAKTTKEAWELMYYNKHGKWADAHRQSWLDQYSAACTSPVYSPSDYSPWSPNAGSTSAHDDFK